MIRRRRVPGSDDLLQFAASLLPPNAEEESAAPLFSPQTVEAFSKRQEPEGSSRALGWDTPSKNSSAGQHFSPHSIGHLGYSGCSLWIDLEAAIAVVLLTNRTWPDRSSQLIREVRPAFHDAVRSALNASPAGNRARGASHRAGVSVPDWPRA